MQAVLFDVDGVLINGYHFYEEFRHYWEKDVEKDLGVSREKFTSLFFSPLWQDIVTGKKDLKISLDDFLPTIGCPATSDAVIQYWLEKDSNINEVLFSQLKKLKDDSEMRLFIATNQEHNRAQHLMENLGFSDYFEDIFYSAKIGFTKTDPNYFLEVDKMLDIRGNKPIFFDDTPKVVQTANNHGWMAYEFHDVESLKQSSFIWDKINLS